MAGGMGFFLYVSDDGNTYKLKGDVTNAGQTPATATTASAAVPWYPRGWQPRYVLAKSLTHGVRKVTVYDPASALWVGGTTTVNLQVAGVADAGTPPVGPVFDVTGRIGEKRTARG